MTRRLATICFVIVLLMGACSPSIRAQVSDPDTQTLKDINAVYVMVEELSGGAKVIGLTADAIQTDVELKLRQAGMRVVTRKEWFDHPDSNPYFYVRLTVTPSGNAAGIELQLRQSALLKRNGEFAPLVTTWDAGYLIPFPTSQRIRDKVKDKVDVFLNAWLSVNPKK